MLQLPLLPLAPPQAVAHSVRLAQQPRHTHTHSSRGSPHPPLCAGGCWPGKNCMHRAMDGTSGSTNTIREHMPCIAALQRIFALCRGFAVALVRAIANELALSFRSIGELALESIHLRALAWNRMPLIHNCITKASIGRGRWWIGSGKRFDAHTNDRQKTFARSPRRVVRGSRRPGRRRADFRSTIFFPPYLTVRAA